MFIYRNKPILKVGLVGLGKSNLGVYSYLSRHFPTLSFTVRADKEIPDIPEWVAGCVFGPGALSNVDEDVLFLSPSVRRDIPELCSARDHGVILSSDAELFFEYQKGDVYAVTGSDGKSTTVYLASELLFGSYGSTLPFGNFGEAMAPHIDEPGVGMALELSSFQLSYMRPSTLRSAITNITPNHLNWHTSFEEYALAKANILHGAKEPVMNYDCPVTRKFFEGIRPYAVFSRKLSLKELCCAVRAEVYVYERGGVIYVNGDEWLRTEDIRAYSEHNVSNFVCAMALCHGRYDRQLLRDVARGFGGLAHRCELLGEIGGVKYYDSSIDSTPKRCAMTLAGFRGNVILILGGRSKGLDFTELIPSAVRVTKKIIIAGECASEIEDALLRSEDFIKSGIPYLIVSDFYGAIDRAYTDAVAGDAVLLSPAATSYDRFKSFEERGDAFKSFLKTKGL